MAKISLIRAAPIDYEVKAGDTFATLPVWFTIDSVAESFAGATLKMQIKNGNSVILTLTELDGITVSTNSLRYTISATDMANLIPGAYSYDVQKTVSGIISTIQEGKITVKPDQTT